MIKLTLNVRNLLSVRGIYLTVLPLMLLLNRPLSAQSAANCPLPELVLPSGVGVNTHFVAGHARDLDMIAAAGIKYIRQDLTWAITETVKGEYYWSAYDSLLSDLKARGLRLIFTLNYNNSLYSNQEDLRWGVIDSANITGYANWAAAAAKHFAGNNILWEIWNEPNAVNFWKPGPNAEQYAIMALATCKAIRKADPNASIIAPGLAMFNWNFTAGISEDEHGIRGLLTWEFIKALFKYGVHEYLCALSVHPYRDGPPQSPETIAPEYRGFNDLVTKYLPQEEKGRIIPLISGEWGYTNCKCVEGVLPQTQANWLARMQMFNMYLGIPITIWYDWKDDGPDITVRGQNRGLVTHDLKLKPSYIAMTTLTHQLSGYRIIKRYQTGSENDYIFVLKNSDGKVKFAAWTQSEKHEVKLSLPELSLPELSGKIYWINGNAETGDVSVSSGSFRAELNSTPKYCSTEAPVPMPAFENLSK